MSDHGSYPPPGAPPPGPPPGASAGPAQGSAQGPAWGAAWGTAPPAPAWAPAPGMLGAAHKPGAMPLRPLRLGDMFDATFRIIRFNPRATVGAAVLVAAVAMAVPVLVTVVAAVAAGGLVDLDPSSGGTSTAAQVVGSFGALGSLLVGLVALQVGLVLVIGIVAHVAHAAATGRRLGLGEAWAATRGTRWRLVGLMLVLALVPLAVLAVWGVTVLVLVLLGASTLAVVLWAVASGLLLVLPLEVVFYVRCSYLAPSALVLEPGSGVFGSIGRAWRLTRGQFWRVLGIALLTALVAGVGGSMLSVPISVVGQVTAVAFPEVAILTLVLAQALSQVASQAFVAPFTASVSTLQYLDQRMRKEAYDVELMSQAGITGA